MQIIVDELKAVRDKYGDERRTEIIDESGEFRIEDLIADEDMAITVSNTGYIKRTRDLDLPQPAPRRQGPHRHADARRGLRQPPVRRLDARLHHDLLGPRPRLLAEGPRDPGRRSRRQGQGDREPGVDGGRREDRRAAGGEGVRGRQVRRDGHAQAASSRRPTLSRVQQPARRRHHRDGRRGRRRGDRRRRSPTAPSEIFIGTRDGMAIRFDEDRRPADGPHRLRRPRHHAARRRRGRGDGGGARRAARC